VVPDVIVRLARDGTWAIELNSETLPRVLVNNRYYSQVSRNAKRDEDQVFLSECYANANWLIKSLDQRARTILSVSREIVRQQDGFLVHGVQALRPLNLRTVAEAIGVHESTVSRVTANKYMATPRGTFEMRYFFTASIAAAQGGEAHSAEAVRQQIKELINAETAESVLSDDAIVERLRAVGIEIARRTVTKYRESLGLASSVGRRRDKRLGA
jgi:RNA polymerase sigma-54 factor